MPDVDLVHLIWKPFGPRHLHDFLAAYRAMPAGCEHRLVLLFNGFDESEVQAYLPLAADLPHHVIRLAEPVQDIPAYLEAARRLSGEFLCFCNSYSAPLAAGWLGMLHRHAAAPGVGLVGASGSWESHLSDLRRSYSPTGLARIAASRLAPARGASAGTAATPRGALPPRGTLATIRARWREFERVRANIPPFPNPHLRTNGLMIRRELLCGLRHPPIRDKFDAHAFESGWDGLSRQVLGTGRRLLTVGRDGAGYAPPEWWRSGGYRSGAQENLLIADNRTREFDALDDASRAVVRLNTWGADPEATARGLASS